MQTSLMHNKLTIQMLSTPPSTAAASLDLKGFHTLYSTLDWSSFYTKTVNEYHFTCAYEQDSRL
jgi:hypothetical protein